MSEKLAQQFLSFRLNSEIFAFTIDRVREVIDFTQITHIPRMPDYMLGVVNLRGSVVPVMDLKKKMRLPDSEKTKDTCIIIFDVLFEGEMLTLGAIADSVQEVFEMDKSDIEDPPQIGTQINTEFIEGLANYKENFVLVLKIDKIFTADEITNVAHKETTEKLVTV